MMTHREELRLVASRCKSQGRDEGTSACNFIKILPSDGESYGGKYYGVYGKMPQSSENYFGEHEQVPPSEDMDGEDTAPTRVYDPKTRLWFMPQEYLVFTKLRTHTFEHTKVFGHHYLLKRVWT
jgi:hypothetical protein